MATIGISQLDDTTNAPINGVVENHAAKVQSIFDHYLAMWGDTGNYWLTQFPTDASTEASTINSTVSSSPYKIVNNSWGSFSLSQVNGSLLTYHPDVYAADKAAFDAGQTWVFAAGNWGKFAPLTCAFEACTPFVISVSAYNPTTGNIANYSSVNPGITNFIADGTCTTYPPDPTSNGTSFACPRVTSLIALVQSGFNNALTQSEIHTILDTLSDGQLMIQDGQSLSQNPGYFYKVINDNTFNLAKSLPFAYSPGSLPIRAMVEALYGVELNRVSDKAGLDYWTNIALTQGISVVEQQFHAYQVSGYAMEGVPLFEKVQDVIHLLLGRESTDSEMSQWLDTIQHEQHLGNAYSPHTYDIKLIENEMANYYHTVVPAWM